MKITGRSCETYSLLWNEWIREVCLPKQHLRKYCKINHVLAVDKDAEKLSVIPLVSLRDRCLERNTPNPPPPPPPPPPLMETVYCYRSQSRQRVYY